ncbi:MAG: hypothetical protein IJ809_01685 [Clostridia bacterium]|nr:hypothetical protein [Clostridia bacterium]
MKVKDVVIVAVILVVIFFTSNTNVICQSIANYNGTVVFSKGASSSITEINLVPEENENVKKGKLAPGMKATAELYIDLSDLDFDVEARIKLLDDIYNAFDIKFIIDDVCYSINDAFVIPRDDERIKRVYVELFWKDLKSSMFVVNAEKLLVSFDIEVKQVLK